MLGNGNCALPEGGDKGYQGRGCGPDLFVAGVTSLWPLASALPVAMGTDCGVLTRSGQRKD